MVLEAGLAALIIKLLAVIPIATAVTVLVLNFTQIIDWFKVRRTNIPEVDKARIYFTMRDLWAAGNYCTVQGVFDRTTQQTESVRSIRSSAIDTRLAAYHRDYSTSSSTTVRIEPCVS
jgi:hypothetical protein